MGERLRAARLHCLRGNWFSEGAVLAEAYGWPEALVDRAQPENRDAADRKAAEEEILKRLFDLNQERASAGR